MRIKALPVVETKRESASAQSRIVGCAQGLYSSIVFIQVDPFCGLRCGPGVLEELVISILLPTPPADVSGGVLYEQT